MIADASLSHVTSPASQRSSFENDAPCAQLSEPNSMALPSSSCSASVASKVGFDCIGDLEIKIVDSSRNETAVATSYSVQIIGLNGSYTVSRQHREFEEIRREMLRKERKLHLEGASNELAAKLDQMHARIEPTFQAEEKRLGEVVTAAVAAAADAELLDCPPALRRFLGLDEDVSAVSFHQFPPIELCTSPSVGVSTVSFEESPAGEFCRSRSLSVSKSSCGEDDFSFDQLSRRELFVMGSPDARTPTTEVDAFSPITQCDAELLTQEFTSEVQSYASFAGSFAMTYCSESFPPEKTGEFNTRTPYSMTKAAVADKWAAPGNVEVPSPSQINKDGFWFHEGFCVAHVADSQVHWLADDSFTPLMQCTSGKWAVLIDGNRFQVKLHRQEDVTQLVWSDGATWERQDSRVTKLVEKEASLSETAAEADSNEARIREDTLKEAPPLLRTTPWRKLPSVGTWMHHVVESSDRRAAAEMCGKDRVTTDTRTLEERTEEFKEFAGAKLDLYLNPNGCRNAITSNCEMNKLMEPISKAVDLYVEAADDNLVRELLKIGVRTTPRTLSQETAALESEHERCLQKSDESLLTEFDWELGRDTSDLLQKGCCKMPPQKVAAKTLQIGSHWAEITSELEFERSELEFHRSCLDGVELDEALCHDKSAQKYCGGGLPSGYHRVPDDTQARDRQPISRPPQQLVWSCLTINIDRTYVRQVEACGPEVEPEPVEPEPQPHQDEVEQYEECWV